MFPGADFGGSMRTTIPALEDLGRHDIDASCSCSACLRLHDAITASALARHRVAEIAREVDRVHRIPSSYGGARAHTHHPADDGD